MYQLCVKSSCRGHVQLAYGYPKYFIGLPVPLRSVFKLATIGDMVGLETDSSLGTNETQHAWALRRANLEPCMWEDMCARLSVILGHPV